MSRDTPVKPQSPYDMLGGEAGVRAVVTEFYHLMDSLPEAAPILTMHQGGLAEMCRTQ